jgi:hypothetical protein
MRRAALVACDWTALALLAAAGLLTYGASRLLSVGIPRR